MQVELVGFGILGRPGLDRLSFLGQQPDLQGRDRRLRDLVLQREDVAERPVVTLGPDMAP